MAHAQLPCRTTSRHFLALHEHVTRFVCSLRKKHGLSPHALEDDVQEAMTTILANISTYVPERGSLRSWAFGVTFNVMVERQRKRYRYDNHFEPEDALDGWEPLAAQTDPESLVHARQVHNKLMDAFGGLSEIDRAIFQLAIVEGLSHGDIAKQLGISEDVSKKRYSRAKQWLAKQINVPADELYSVMPPLLLGEAPPEPSERARQRRLLDLSRHCGFFASVLLAATLAAPRWVFVSAQTGLFVPDAHIALAKVPAQKQPDPVPPRAMGQNKKTATAKLDEARLRSLTLAPEFMPSGH